MRLTGLILLIVSFSFSLLAKDLAAVLELQNNGGLSEGEIRIITERIEYFVGQSESFEILNRRDIDNILKEQGFQQSGACSESSCILEIGQLLAAKRMFAGAIGKMGSLYSLSLKMYDVSTGAVIAQVARDVSSSKEALLSKHVPIVVNELIESAGAKPVKLSNVSDRSLFKRAVFWIPVVGLAVGGGVAALLLSRDQSQGGGDPADSDKVIAVSPPSRD